MFVITDLLWKQIKSDGKPPGAGLLCGACIMSRIEEVSDYDYWFLRKDADTNLETFAGDEGDTS